jgi:glutathione S-transferase
MKLYHMPRTRSARVIWTAHEVGAHLDVEPLDLRKGEGRSPDHLARHPHGKLPAAVIDGHKLIESGAIALHLAARHKPNSSFLPDLATLKGAEVLQWAFYAVSTLDDLTIDAFLQQFAPEERKNPALVDKAANQWKQTITPFVSSKLGSSPYLLGPEFSFADVMVGYTTFFAGQMGWLDDTLAAYVGRISERPGFKAAFGM